MREMEEEEKRRGGGAGGAGSGGVDSGGGGKDKRKKTCRGRVDLCTTTPKEAELQRLSWLKQGS